MAEASDRLTDPTLADLLRRLVVAYLPERVQELRRFAAAAAYGVAS